MTVFMAKNIIKLGLICVLGWYLLFKPEEFTTLTGILVVYLSVQEIMALFPWE